MKIKVADATLIQLDWLVAKSDGLTEDTVHWCLYDGYITSIGADIRFTPSTNWAQGGPITDQMIRDGVTLGSSVGGWATARFWTENKTYIGATLLEAAMRCYVASKLGEEVEVPEELS